MSHDNHSKTITAERSESTDLDSATPDRKDSAAAPVSASPLAPLFGEPLLLPGENRSDFDTFFQPCFVRLTLLENPHIGAFRGGSANR